ncbi:uncharacterized protein LOC127081787 [Lathyrus oleraceus]|uniref:uncharacterized protein LOC127081787 n=1 Tax=Pisum sativum TaxID=3888 RepID=UPI0021D17C86|nr:uncharacterized protein LOC127081787 [Pisum sativum]
MGEYFILKEKLKLVKEALRNWNKEVFGFIEVDKAVSYISKLEALKEVMKQSFRRNEVVGLMTQEGWTENAQEVNDGIRNHFEASFKESIFWRPNLNGIDLTQLSVEDILSLEFPYEEEEVKDVVWQCINDKSPGPDGFNMNFFKACWDILKVDIMNFVSHFFCRSKVPRAVMTYFLTLIPKSKIP